VCVASKGGSDTLFELRMEQFASMDRGLKGCHGGGLVRLARVTSHCARARACPGISMPSGLDGRQRVVQFSQPSRALLLVVTLAAPSHPVWDVVA
jgi:hypothetical protein